MAAPSARALRMPLTLSDGARRPSLLLIEDSKLLVRILGARLERELGIDVVPATSLAQARELLERDSSRFFLALVDLVLPDAPRGEAVNLVTRTGIPRRGAVGQFRAACARSPAGQARGRRLRPEQPCQHRRPPSRWSISCAATAARR